MLRLVIFSWLMPVMHSNLTQCPPCVAIDPTFKPSWWHMWCSSRTWDIKISSEPMDPRNLMIQLSGRSRDANWSIAFTPSISLISTTSHILQLNSWQYETSHASCKSKSVRSLRICTERDESPKFCHVSQEIIPNIGFECETFISLHLRDETASWNFYLNILPSPEKQAMAPCKNSGSLRLSKNPLGSKRKP